MKCLTLAQVIEKTGRRKTAIYADIKAGNFPAPAHAGRRSIWDEVEVDAYLQALFAKRPNAHQGVEA